MNSQFENPSLEWSSNLQRERETGRQNVQGPEAGGGWGWLGVGGHSKEAVSSDRRTSHQNLALG